MIEPTVVRTLMGAGSIVSSIVCLRSVLACSNEPLQLIIHDDGTLKAEHCDRLRAEVDAKIQFISRQQADDTILPQLSRYPACLAYRQIAPLALKLFDTVLLSKDRLDFIDSDILFYKNVKNIFSSKSVESPIFMDNTTHSYAIRPWYTWPFGSIRLCGRINSGIIVGWNSGIDLDFIDWVLSRLSQNIVYKTRSYWVEQTCWAVMAARTTSRLFDPRQIVMASATMSGVTELAVAIHFVSTYRNTLQNYQWKSPDKSQQPIEVLSFPTNDVTALGLLWSDIRRRLS